MQVWKGVPYARPPVGARRFRPPEPPEPWAGVRPATRFGRIAAQPIFPVERLFRTERARSGEDCLYLNVWSPAADDARRPVLVWLHGGAFVAGSGSFPWYDGAAFAAHGDVVVVTLNYRLGLLGFLHLADLGDAGAAFAGAGNLGLLDQVAALQWVRDNIAVFGGDPGRVTVFGESAGAMSIGALLATPAARGLFHQAILESGAADAAHDRATATRVAAELLANLGVRPDQLAALADVPLDRILGVQGVTRYTDPASDALRYQPVVDGVVLPQSPREALAAGVAADIPVLIGTNHDEMRLFTTFDPGLARTDSLRRRAARRVGPELWPALVEAYTAARPGAKPKTVYTDILTDLIFRRPAIRLAEHQVAHGAPTWMYRFDWPTPALRGRLRACHALELPFVWDNLNQRGVSLLTGRSIRRQPLANRMHAAWLAFARTGDPNVPDLPSWPRYDCQRRATLIFHEVCRVEDDPQAVERRAWDGRL